MAKRTVTPPFFEEFLSRANFRTVKKTFRKHRSNLISFNNGPNKRNKVTLDYYILLNQSEVDYIMSAIDCTTLPPLSVVSDHKLLKLKFKWRLKINVMAHDVVNEANQRVIRNNILQDNNFDPATVGLANYYGNFSEAVKNSVRLNVPCLAPLF